MSVVILKIAEGRTTSEKKALIASVSRAMADCLNLSSHSVHVFLDEYPVERMNAWTVGRSNLHSMPYTNKQLTEATAKLLAN